MMIKTNVEFKRQTLQNLLDTQKNQQERNILGQFSTPKFLADSIIKSALEYINEKIRFLDTSIGTGVFFSSLLEQTGRNNISYACGYEIDDHYALPAISFWQNEKIDYFIGDFFDFTPPKNDKDKYNLIISNPPYIRHHYITNTLKKELNKRIKNKFGLSFSGLTGLYGYFMTLSSLWLQKNGISVWLVPNEFLDVNYGREIKEFLLTKVKLLRIHKFNPLQTQFSDALVTSTVVFYTTGETSASVLFTTGNDINKPSIQKNIFYKNLNSSDKWSNYFSNKSYKRKNGLVIGDFFSVKRGIATGSNKHFILTDKEIKGYNIPEKYLMPILPSPRYIKDNIIEIGSNGCIAGLENRYLLNITCSENDISNLPDNLINYLKNIYIEIKDYYIIKNRSPWYKQEYRPECPFLISYMGRNPSKPFRLFLNKTKATAPNVYLLLYPKFNWKETESQYIGFLRELHIKLQNVKPDIFVSSGRVYGGGLYKLEPKELTNMPIDNIFSDDLIHIMQKSINQ